MGGRECLTAIRKALILVVGTPIWLGHPSCPCQPPSRPLIQARGVVVVGGVSCGRLRALDEQHVPATGLGVAQVPVDDLALDLPSDERRASAARLDVLVQVLVAAPRASRRAPAVSPSSRASDVSPCLVMVNARSGDRIP